MTLGEVYKTVSDIHSQSTERARKAKNALFERVLIAIASGDCGGAAADQLATAALMAINARPCGKHCR